MNNKVSSNFLLLKDWEQKNIINYLSKDLRRRELYLHFAQLYTLKMNFLKDQKNRQSKEPIKSVPNQGFQHTKEDYKNVISSTINPYPKFEKKIEESSKIDTSKKNIKLDQEQKKVNLENIKTSLKELKKKKVNPEKREEKQVIKKEMTPNYSIYIQKFMVQEKLKKLVEGKSVVIVGPANYLINTNQGESIDNYDVVIRFNGGINSVNHFYNNIGRKTDIWFYNFKDLSVLDNLPEKMPKLLFCPYPKEMIDGYGINKSLPNCPIEFIESHFYNQLQLVMNFEPNSALLAILILLRQNIKSLYVTGISFYYDGYYDNSKKNDEMTAGALVVNNRQRNNFMLMLKKIYNVNEKLILDNTIVNLIYPNFILVLNKIFSKENLGKLYSTMNYMLFIPSFQQKYNAPNSNTKIYVHFGIDPVENGLNEKMNLMVHSIKPRMYENEVYIKNDECDYDDLETLLGVRNKGIIYFSNNQWTAIDNMIPKKNRDYILRHHCYVNGNLYGAFINYVTTDFDINEDNKNLNMLYVLFSLIYFGQKMIYLSRENILNNGLKEIVNVMNKLNLIKYIK